MMNLSMLKTALSQTAWKENDPRLEEIKISPRSTSMKTLFTTQSVIILLSRSCKSQQSIPHAKPNEIDAYKDITHRHLLLRVPLQQTKTSHRSKHVKCKPQSSKTMEVIKMEGGQEASTLGFQKHSKYMVRNGRKFNSMSLLEVQHRPDHMLRSSLVNQKSENLLLKNFWPISTSRN